MANITIDNLPQAVGLDGTEFVPIAKNTGNGYVTDKTTTGAIATVGTNAEYILASEAITLPNSRVIAAQSGQVTLTDSGPLGNMTIGLATSGVTAGTYGDSTHVPQIAVDATGRLTNVSNIDISSPTFNIITANTLALRGSTSGQTLVVAQAVASGTLSLPSATDTLVGRATTDTLTNKTFDTAGAGNIFRINGTQITAVTGTGAAVLATSPILVTPTIGSASGTSLNLSGLTASSAVATDASKNLVSVTNTGSGNNVLATSPTLVAPNLGTPSSLVLTNATGLPISTGVSGLGTGIAAFLGTPTSANLAAALTDETGTGAAVFANSPSLTTPSLGVATATSINKVAVTAPATSATLTIANGTTLTSTSSTSVGQGQYLGTATNDNATAGNVGEYVQSEIASGSAVSLTTGTATSITSITLTPGDWNVWGSFILNPAGSTVISSFSAGVNLVTNTLPTAPNGGSYVVQVATFPAGGIQGFPVGMRRYSVSTNTTIYLIVSANFTTSTLTAYGGIYARRVR